MTCIFIFFVYLTLFANSLAASIFTDWLEFPGGPVYDPYPYPTYMLVDDYFPNVLFNKHKFDGHGDEVFYKMWHTSPNGIALSYSDDGIHWSLQGEVILGAGIEKPQVLYDKHGFGGGPYFYKMWYWTGSASPVAPILAIKFTQSVDGINWTTPITAMQDTIHPLNDNAGNSAFSQFFGFGTVIYNPSAQSIPSQPFSFPYVTFYDVASGGPPITYMESVALAFSNDGINWKRFGSEPVLKPSGNTTDWDSQFNVAASVIFLKLDDLYHAFYTGSDNIPSSGPPLPYAHGIGHAFSHDGINWIKDPDNPIFITTQGVPWRVDHIIGPSVVIGEDYCPLLRMWFSGGNSEANGGPADKEIGYAILPNPDRLFLKKCKKKFK